MLLSYYIRYKITNNFICYTSINHAVSFITVIYKGLAIQYVGEYIRGAFCIIVNVFYHSHVSSENKDIVCRTYNGNITTKPQGLFSDEIEKGFNWQHKIDR